MNVPLNRSKRILYIFSIIFLLILLNHCTKTEPITGEKVIMETNERVENTTMETAATSATKTTSATTKTRTRATTKV